MRKNVNQFHCEGIVYEHELELKVTGERSKNPGTQFITGKLRVATDDELLNIVDIHYTYVTATTAKGGPNATYNVLKGLIDGTYKTHMNAGPNETPICVRVDTSIGLNDFYSTQQSTEPTLVSAKRNEGGFVHIIRPNELNPKKELRNMFTTDMVITNLIHKDADEVRNLPEKVILKGVIFDFRNAILPVEFSVVDPGAISYFESEDISGTNPCYTQVRGTQVNKTVMRQVVSESPWGSTIVEEKPDSYRDFIVYHTAKEKYPFGDEGILTADELREAIANRNVYLATVKQRYDEYQAQKASGTTTTAQKGPAINAGGFKF